MRYVIFHTPRTGSNVLCDLLVQTKKAGMTDLYTAGFFIGFGEKVREAYQNGAVKTYFDKNRTKNGVEGCKIGMDYIYHLVKALPFGKAEKFLRSFDRYIILSRQDRVRQAVSRLMARQSGIWQSGDAKPRENALPVEYNRDKLAWYIADAAAAHMFFDMWLAQYDIEPLRMTYEENARDWNAAVTRVLDFIGVEAGELNLTPTLRKQVDARKEEWAGQYREIPF